MQLASGNLPTHSDMTVGEMLIVRASATKVR